MLHPSKKRTRTLIAATAKTLRKWGSCSKLFWWPRCTQLNSLACLLEASAYSAGYLTPNLRLHVRGMKLKDGAAGLRPTRVFDLRNRLWQVAPCHEPQQLAAGMHGAAATAGSSQ